MLLIPKVSILSEQIYTINFLHEQTHLYKDVQQWYGVDPKKNKTYSTDLGSTVFQEI